MTRIKSANRDDSGAQRAVRCMGLLGRVPIGTALRFWLYFLKEKIKILRCAFEQTNKVLWRCNEGCQYLYKRWTLYKYWAG